MEEFEEYFRPLSGHYLTGGPGSQCTDALLGLLCRTLGRLDAAASHFEDAVTFCRPSLQPELAWTLYDYATTLSLRNAPGDGERARSLLDEGVRVCRDLGMLPLLAKIEAALGERAEPSLYGLSQREREVLGQMAKGFSNQEIGAHLHISQHTVAAHVRRILQKTRTANRVEAVALATREGIR